MEITQKEIAYQIQRAKKGKQGAFKFLLDHYWNDVYGFQLKRIRNEHDAEDITIEAFAKAFGKIETFDDKYTFSTWLLTISKNIQIDRTRRKNASIYSNTTDALSEQVQKIADPFPNPEDKLIREQNLSQLLQYIKLLKPHYQEVINLFYFQEMSYNEISEKLEEPLNNVKVRLLRARKLLAEIIVQKE